MGAGKTTVGQTLARMMHYRFFDTDTLIEQIVSQSVSEIFASAGESAFRQMESQVLGELSAYTRLAVATGGGIVLERKNWSYLHQGLIVWLDVPVELLISRLESDSTRPLLQNTDLVGKLQNLLAQRQQLYAQADLKIPVSEGETPEQIAVRVIDAIPQVLKPAAYPPATLN